MIRKNVPSSPLFRGRELTRLLAMIVMLLTTGMLITQARNPRAWFWLTGESPGVATPPTAKTSPAAAKAREQPFLDQDAEEVGAWQEEFQALSDKTALAAEEMPAYWRLMRWQADQTLEELERRADRQVRYAQFFQRPDYYRGRLVALSLELKQAIVQDQIGDNPLGIERVYEVHGASDDSKPFSYWLVMPSLPQGMPLGTNLSEQATFFGYFLKLLSYADREGRERATPLLIGRLVWHPAPAVPKSTGGDLWWVALAATIAAFLVIRAIVSARSVARGKPRRDRSATADTPGDAKVEAWLSGAAGPPWATADGDGTREEIQDQNAEEPLDQLDSTNSGEE